MGRLTRHDYNEDACDICTSWVLCKGNDCLLYDLYEKLAHYEDMEEQGRLIEVIRCEDCRYERHCEEAQYLGADGYCSKAELKELEE